MGQIVFLENVSKTLDILNKSNIEYLYSIRLCNPQDDSILEDSPFVYIQIITKNNKHADIEFYDDQILGCTMIRKSKTEPRIWTIKNIDDGVREIIEFLK